MAIPRRPKMVNRYVDNYYDDPPKRTKKYLKEYVNQRSWEMGKALKRVLDADGIDYCSKSDRPKIVAVCLDWSGRKYFEIPRHPLEDAGITVVPDQIEQGRYVEGIETRETWTTENGIMKLKKERPRRVMIFDKSVQTGASLASAISWIMDYIEVFGIEKIYTMVLMDAAGMANFVLDKEASKVNMRSEKRLRRVGPIEFIEKNIPTLYRKIEPKTHLLDGVPYEDYIEMCIHEPDGISSDIVSGQPSYGNGFELTPQIDRALLFAHSDRKEAGENGTTRNQRPEDVSIKNDEQTKSGLIQRGFDSIRNYILPKPSKGEIG